MKPADVQRVVGAGVAVETTTRDGFVVAIKAQQFARLVDGTRVVTEQPFFEAPPSNPALVGGVSAYRPGAELFRLDDFATSQALDTIRRFANAQRAAVSDAFWRPLLDKLYYDEDINIDASVLENVPFSFGEAP